MLYFLRDISFVRIIIPFIAGIMAAVFLSYSLSILMMLMICFGTYLLFMLIHISKAINKNYRLRWITGVAVYFVMFAAGFSLCRSRTEILDRDHFGHHMTDSSIVVAQITEPLSEKKNSYKTIVDVKEVVTKGKTQPTIGQALLYFKKDSTLPRKLRYGDILLLKNNFDALPAPQNPGEFDYKEFMSFRQIYHQAYLTPEDWKLTSENRANWFFSFVISLRQHLFEVLEKHLTSKKALAVSSSLLLGLREKLDDDIIKAYSTSGAMHVLAVSGLHVGIIYYIISSMLFFMKEGRKKILKSVLIVLFIWLYACVTGLSPSVMRAAVMFTFIASAENLRRSTNIFNVLAGSAFCLLCWNPFLLMEVGFQLSYVAVVGIVVFQPKIYNLLHTKNWLLDKVWMIICVSAAAQLATFPIGLLYFHQFPVYFFVSNLVVIPAATIILYVGLSLFAFSAIAPVAGIIGWLLNYIVVVLNKAIFLIQQLPYSFMEGLAFTVPESWIIYAAIGSFAIFIYYQRNAFLISSLALLVVFFAWQTVELALQQNQSRMIVYNVSKMSAIDFQKGNHNVMIADSTLLTDTDKMLFHIKHNWRESGIKKPNTMMSLNTNPSNIIHAYNNFIQFKDKRIKLINKAEPEVANKPKLKLDYLIISKNADVQLASLSNTYDFKQIIFDSSNSWWKVKQWKQEAEKLGLSTYDVKEKGAFILKI